MTLPEDAPPALAWCGVWVVLALALLTAAFQLANDAGLRARAERRTLNRLADLNSFLNVQLDQQWKISTQAEIIPDSQALANLKRQVDRASAVDDWLSRRTTLLEAARALAAFELLAALVVAGLVATFVGSSALVVPAMLIAGLGLGASAVAIFVAVALGIRVAKGADYL